MNNNKFRSTLIPLFVVPIGGLIVLAMIYGVYLGVYLGLESIIKPSQLFVSRTDLFRSVFALIVIVVYLFVYRSKLGELPKAVLMIGPIAMLLITLIFRYYENLTLTVSVFGLAVAGLSYLLYKDRKPWFFYYALGFAALLALLYGWPR